MVLPASGPLPVQGHLPGSISGTKSKRAIVIKLPEEIVQALIARRGSNPNDPPLDVDFSENAGIHIGSHFFATEFATEERHHEIFTRASNKAQAPLRHYASVEGKILVKRVLDENISNKVKKSTLASQDKAKARPIQLLSTPPTLTKSNIAKKKRSASKPMGTHTRNDSLHSNGSTSTNPIRASPIPPSILVTKTNEAQANMRYHLVHFLALSPKASVDVIQIVGGLKPDASTKSQISTLLSQVAIEDPKRSGPTPPPRLWRLKNESWFEVRPYEYPNLKDDERKRMSLQARQVFKTMSILESDPRWEHIKYRPSASSNPQQNTQTRQDREPSPLPPVNSRRKLPGSQNNSSQPKARESVPDAQASTSLQRSITKEQPMAKLESKLKVPHSIRQGDNNQSQPYKQLSTDRAHRKRERDHDIEDDLLKTSETKRRRSDDDVISTPKSSARPSNGTRSNNATPSNSKTTATPTGTSKPAKTNGSSASKRRKSPIYTSSSSESGEEVKGKGQASVNGTSSHVPPKKSPSPNVSVVRKPPLYVMPKIAFGGALPRDHASLRRRYNAIYPSYILVYQKRVEQRMVIEKMLEESPVAEEGEVEEGLLVGSDVEMMEASDLERLNADLSKLENELGRINSALQSEPK